MATGLKAGVAKRFLEWAPKLAAKPLALVPFAVKSQLIRQMLQQVLAEQEKDGELEFLAGRQVAIQISDLQLEFLVSYDRGWHISPFEASAAEVCFRAPSQELLLVVAGKEDPDTLFFQRRLSIEGDTELGLEVKNLLLSVEFDALPAPVRVSVQKLAITLQQLQQLAAGPEATPVH
ncbi:SCP2 sterol-binding domain-containing protein [Shewanella corallii]|uniref:Ubiquinone biosynthesis accessory factor UbiT n=1 Tax=Shewanella corallii TaxID=560080 RepID=A0ABT0N762_9GAMM|nr:SCP2 sterol-binding domain-containing protein [Shewanella corallii]MCL2913672.1 SCP2 sterol-binding domain-containing protein [Shewanella corallii]